MSRFVILVLFFFVLVRPLFVIIFHNPFLIWVSLEVGTFSVVPLLFLKGSSRRVEASLKYFVIRITSSLVFLFGNVLSFHNVFFFEFFLRELGKKKRMGFGVSLFFIYLPLLVKLGIFPFHFWFPEVVKGVGFLEGLILSTVQKISPLYLIYIIKRGLFKIDFIFLVGSLSVLVGGWGGLNQTQIRKMMGFSSVSFMGWLFCLRGEASFYPLLYLFITYFFVSGSLFFFFYYTHLIGLSHLNKVVFFPVFVGFLTIGFFSLIGIPPFGGFSLKLFPFFSLFKSKNIFLLLLVFVPGTLFSLFFYLRLLFNLCFLIPPVRIKTFFFFRTKAADNFLFSYLLGWVFSGSIFLFCFFDVIYFI